MKSTVSSKGQITVPAKIRSKLGLAAQSRKIAPSGDLRA